MNCKGGTMHCEDRNCLGTVEAKILTPSEVVLNCNRCTRAYYVPYAILKADIRRRRPDAHLGAHGTE